jgi:hypothetical protein
MQCAHCGVYFSDNTGRVLVSCFSTFSPPSTSSHSPYALNRKEIKQKEW